MQEICLGFLRNLKVLINSFPALFLNKKLNQFLDRRDEINISLYIWLCVRFLIVKWIINKILRVVDSKEIIKYEEIFIKIWELLLLKVKRSEIKRFDRKFRRKKNAALKHVQDVNFSVYFEKWYLNVLKLLTMNFYNEGHYLLSSCCTLSKLSQCDKEI